MKHAVRRGDLLVAALVLVTALGWLAVRAVRPAAGQCVTVDTPEGTRVLPLDTPCTLTLYGHADMTVTVEIADGAAWVAHSDCPDQLCVHTGRLSRAGATAACVPAGVVLRIEGEAEVDAIAY